MGGPANAEWDLERQLLKTQYQDLVLKRKVGHRPKQENSKLMIKLKLAAGKSLLY